MRYKGAVIAAIILGIYTWFVWPSAQENKLESQAENTKEQNSTPKESRQPDREASKKIVKKVSHAKEGTANSLRLDPDVKLDDTRKNAQRVIEEKGYGTFPAVDLKDSNPQKEHLLKALQDPKNNSGSISIVGKRKQFDIGRYKSDPTYYLNSVEPGRCFDSAQAEEGVNRLQRSGKSTLRTEQKKTVQLSAKGENGMPISFTAFDGAHFQNGLSFITLKADSSGTAVAEFTPTEGVINQARIRAASPVNSGTLQWTVFVSLPKKVSNNN